LSAYTDVQRGQSKKETDHIALLQRFNAVYRQTLCGEMKLWLHGNSRKESRKISEISGARSARIKPEKLQDKILPDRNLTATLTAPDTAARVKAIG